MGVFDKYLPEAWPIAYAGRLHAEIICGSLPAREETAISWITTKVRDTRSESEVQKMVAEMMAEHQISLTEAVKRAASDMAGLNIFKRTPAGVLYMEGRQLKAALKEAVSVAANEGKLTTKGWGRPDNAAYKKQIKGWFPEHVFVHETVLPMHRGGEPVTEPSGTIQKFIHTHRGDSIGYEEYVEHAEIDFTVRTDHEFSDREWAMIWLTGGPQGIGASRSQGYGTYEITRWDRIGEKR